VFVVAAEGWLAQLQRLALAGNGFVRLRLRVTVSGLLVWLMKVMFTSFERTRRLVGRYNADAFFPGCLFFDCLASLLAGKSLNC
jgi:hypothetical protein